MRLTEPRLTPLADAELNPEQEAVLAGFRAGGRDYNLPHVRARSGRAQGIPRVGRARAVER